MHQRLDEIPTIPNSPIEPFALAAQSLSPAVSVAEWSEIDMMSSIESLARNSPRPPSSQGIGQGIGQGAGHESGQEGGQEGGQGCSHASSRSPACTRGVKERELSMKQGDAEMLEKCTSSISSSSSQYGFVMPSLPKVGREADEPVVGLFHIAVAGSSGGSVLTAMSSRMYDQRKEVRDGGIEIRICSSSICEHGNVIMIDANFVPKEVPKWIESELQRESPIDLVVYTIARDGPSDEDVRAMLEIQSLAELVVVAADMPDVCSSSSSPTDEKEELRSRRQELELVLANNGISGFQKRVWYITTQLERNWDMTFSAVEAPGYNSYIPSNGGSDLPTLVSALTRSSGRIRATTRIIQARWFQSQLVVTVTEPADALAHRVNLRRKALESIGNLDPLGIVHWSSLPRVTAAIVTGIVTGTLAALGLSALCSRLLTDSQVQPTCRRHAIFDMENWPQWLV